VDPSLPFFAIMEYCRDFEHFAEKYLRGGLVHSEALQSYITKSWLSAFVDSYEMRNFSCISYINTLRMNLSTQSLWNSHYGLSAESGLHIIPISIHVFLTSTQLTRNTAINHRSQPHSVWVSINGKIRRIYLSRKKLCKKKRSDRDTWSKWFKWLSKRDIIFIVEVNGGF